MAEDVGTGSSKCIGGEKPCGDGTNNDNATNVAIELSVSGNYMSE
jgi:hypothetical protein